MKVSFLCLIWGMLIPLFFLSYVFFIGLKGGGGTSVQKEKNVWEHLGGFPLPPYLTRYNGGISQLFLLVFAHNTQAGLDLVKLNKNAGHRASSFHCTRTYFTGIKMGKNFPQTLKLLSFEQSLKETLYLIFLMVYFDALESFNQTQTHSQNWNISFLQIKDIAHFEQNSQTCLVLINLAQC